MTAKKTAPKAKPGAANRKTPAKAPSGHRPTDQGRANVRAMAGYGIPQPDIALSLGIGDKTLRKHYRKELSLGATVANAKVGESLYSMAVGRPAQYDAKGNKVRDEQAPVVAAAIFWAKTRMGFKETVSHELGGKEGGGPAIPVRLEGFSLSQLEQFVGRLDAGIAEIRAALPKPKR